jgi:hypothetical protein
MRVEGCLESGGDNYPSIRYLVCVRSARGTNGHCIKCKVENKAAHSCQGVRISLDHVNWHNITAIGLRAAFITKQLQSNRIQIKGLCRQTS